MVGGLAGMLGGGGGAGREGEEAAQRRHKAKLHWQRAFQKAQEGLLDLYDLYEEVFGDLPLTDDDVEGLHQDLCADDVLQSWESDPTGCPQQGRLMSGSSAPAAAATPPAVLPEAVAAAEAPPGAATANVAQQWCGAVQPPPQQQGRALAQPLAPWHNECWLAGTASSERQLHLPPPAAQPPSAGPGQPPVNARDARPPPPQPVSPYGVQGPAGARPRPTNDVGHQQLGTSATWPIPQAPSPRHVLMNAARPYSAPPETTTAAVPPTSAGTTAGVPPLLSTAARPAAGNHGTAGWPVGAQPAPPIQSSPNKPQPQQPHRWCLVPSWPPQPAPGNGVAAARRPTAAAAPMWAEVGSGAGATGRQWAPPMPSRKRQVADGAEAVGYGGSDDGGGGGGDSRGSPRAPLAAGCQQPLQRSAPADPHRMAAYPPVLSARAPGRAWAGHVQYMPYTSPRQPSTPVKAESGPAGQPPAFSSPPQAPGPVARPVREGLGAASPAAAAGATCHQSPPEQNMPYAPLSAFSPPPVIAAAPAAYHQPTAMPNAGPSPRRGQPTPQPFAEISQPKPRPPPVPQPRPEAAGTTPPAAPAAEQADEATSAPSSRPCVPMAMPPYGFMPYGRSPYSLPMQPPPAGVTGGLQWRLRWRRVPAPVPMPPSAPEWPPQQRPPPQQQPQPQPQPQPQQPSLRAAAAPAQGEPAAPLMPYGAAPYARVPYGMLPPRLPQPPVYAAASWVPVRPSGNAAGGGAPVAATAGAAATAAAWAGSRPPLRTALPTGSPLAHAPTDPQAAAWAAHGALEGFPSW
ncbi:hypothetical protein HYH03_006001 [Edaphochlamys debaryana]|uniref:Uncharacterized protein n=1 Tax=Edaphochlamys debaryana TaxID=47281 RepID=A0A835Y3D2_9CHLO|nr:hypothetical protein HYH03_006001 [Edaphochlamys debaryana]|eukprot:KAG2495752.1 hypothetical protein HYH03_006001 [Edaphochlamys debaryana]